jgi:DNA-binding response OmpR family regulator
VTPNTDHAKTFLKYTLVYRGEFSAGVAMCGAGAILIVDSDEKTINIVSESAFTDGDVPLPCSTCKEARHLLSQCHFDAVFCSDNLPDGKYAEIIRAARPTPVIVLSRFAEWDPYLAALHAGAFDYIACPPNPAELERILTLALSRNRQTFRHQASAA